MSHRPTYTNRLIHEKSPYLLQHAHSPVDWYPWGDEAFRASQEMDRPIFLSIGYAACHWCHVMEKESFQDVEIAKEMNETFINILVDREEMPEVDALYMELAQAIMSGGAGWPLNLVLTPEKEPFFATTYLPADASRGMLGIKQLIMRIKQIWSDPEEREVVMMQAGRIVDIFASVPEEEVGQDELPGMEQLAHAEEILFKTADPIYGGSKGSPKFPAAFQSSFLLRRCRENADSRALFYIEKTLEMMQRGGIYDHLGGGFGRYTVDEQWMIPHFEKMLYDNAILVRTYLEAWQYTQRVFYKEVAIQTLDYLLREMKGDEGGFYSAEDADTDGHEGKFYTWTWDELQKELNGDAPLFCEFYGATPGGNFKGRNILHIPNDLSEFAEYRKVDQKDLSKEMAVLREKLWKVREARNHPKKDDKIIASYNGLAIGCFAEAGIVLSESRYLDAAEEAAEFVQKYLWVDGELKRRWREGESRYDGTIDDYAFVASGVLSLFEAGRGVKWLHFALELMEIVSTEFISDSGGFYYTNGRDPNLLLRRCEYYDGSEPSGNAVVAENFLRLHQLTGKQEYKEMAEAIFCAARDHIELYPPGACYHLLAMQRYYDQKCPTIVIALNDQNEYQKEISKMFGGLYIPHKAIVWHSPKEPKLETLVPAVKDKQPIDGKTALYLCYEDRCLEPITDLPNMWEALSKL